jgi:recombination protein RecR
MRAIDELSELFAEFPGVGPRQARRIVQYIIGKDQSFREKLAESLKEIRKSVTQCTECFRFADGAVSGLCSICADKSREQGYFVLGGLIPMARQRKNGNGTRLKDLESRIAKTPPTEVIFALSTTPEGDYTASEIARDLKTKYPSVKITLLGRGLSVGAEIEYADQETIRSALKNRA